MKLDKLQEAYDEMFDFITDLPSGLDGFESDFDAAYKELLEAKSVDDAPVVHAKWENCDWVEPCYHGCGTIRIPNAGMKCTNCVHVFKKDLLWKDNYCPNCGAKMDLEDDE